MIPNVNPNLGGVCRGSFSGGGAVKLLVRIMLETSNLTGKYTHM